MTSSRRRRLWAFNLDAELELARGPGGPFQSPLGVRRALGAMLPQAHRLMAANDRSLDAEASGESPVPAPVSSDGPPLGAAWCPTPSALRRLAQAGAELPRSPAFDVLRRVNHRRFYVDLGGGAPGARYLNDDAELTATLHEPTAGWLFKRPFGFAGRGQRRVLGTPTPDDRRWLSDSLRGGGIVAEPWLELASEVAIHGLLGADGRLALGQVSVQETNTFRAWIGSRRATALDISSADTARLVERAEAVADALARAGYFGPFGLDAYFFRSRSGCLSLNPLGELNARFSMGFAIAGPGLDDLDPSPARASRACE